MSAQVSELVPRRRTVEDLLAEARAGLDRLSPLRASAALRDGALLVDIRPHAQRVAEGEVPGALVVERNVLEWRFDPAGDARLPEAAYDLHLVVLCSEGYTSSLAAAALQSLGVHAATDVDGGFRAWEQAGLPVVPGGTPAGRRSGGRPQVVRVDAERGQVVVEDRPVSVSARQLRLLVALDRAQGKVLPRALAAQAAGLDPRSARAVDVLVCRLRSRLGPRGAERLVTVRGIGFRLLPG